ncbi:MAG: M14 family zinc carboxypeptidase [Clostridia bacterium]
MTYQELVQRIVDLQDEGLEIFNAGKSVLGKNILATHVGSYDGVQILIQGGIHAREYISSLLMIEQARYLNATEMIKSGGIYFVFLTNPDGAEIVLDGINSVPCDITKQYLSLANGGFDFSQYKANINLVDLNTNFDADWGTGSQNVTCPSSENFIGFYPNSEREVISLIDFTRQVKPSLTISYHSKGEVIFYGFTGQSEQDLQRDHTIGESLSEATGYPLVLTENSSGGYKDWCIRVLGIPSYTIEVGNVNLPHPITDENLPEIFEQNKEVPLIALNEAIKYQNQIMVQQTQKPRRRNNWFLGFRR